MRKIKHPCFHGIENKLSRLEQLVNEYGISMDHVSFVGNDVNDLPVMQQVGFPVAVADAYPEVKAIASMETVRPGGYGAVREFCDMLAGIFEKNIRIENAK